MIAVMPLLSPGTWDRIGEYLNVLTRKYPWLDQQVQHLEKFCSYMPQDGDTRNLLLVATIGIGIAFAVNQFTKQTSGKKYPVNDFRE